MDDLSTDDILIIKQIRTAIKQGAIEQVQEIFQNNHEALSITTSVFGSWLHVAAQFGKLDIIKYLVSIGADINKNGGIYGGTAINEAADAGHYDIVKYLLSKGAKLDISEPERNPLFGAIMSGNKNIVQLLLDNGIDASVRYTGDYMNNMDAYDFAIERGQKEIAAMLEPYRK